MTEERINELIKYLPGGAQAEEVLRTAIREAYQHAAMTAKTFHDFGPSTRCPKCGEADQVLRWYTMGRDDAAKAVAALALA